jgi:hypothetical protein
MVSTRSKVGVQDDVKNRDDETKPKKPRPRKSGKNFVITIAPPPSQKKSEKSDDSENDSDDDLDSFENEEEEEDEFELPYSILENRELRQKAEEIIQYIKDHSPSLETILTAKMRKKNRAELFEWFMIYENTMPMSEERMMLRRQIFKMMKNFQKEYNEYKVHKKAIEGFEDDEKHHNDISDIQFDILRLETSDEHKKVLYQKFCELREKEDMDEEFFKQKTWLRQALQLPFDRLKYFPESENVTQHLLRVKKIFDEELYGMHKVKEQLLLFIHGKMINPDMKGCCLGLVGEPGVGKCLHPLTEVLMYDGSFQKAKDLVVGDVLMGDDSTPRVIQRVDTGRQLMYKVHQQNGMPYTVNSSHILTVYNKKTEKLVDMSIHDYKQLLPHEKKEYCGVKASVDFVSLPLTFPDIPVRTWGRLWASHVSRGYFLFHEQQAIALDDSVLLNVLRGDFPPEAKNFLEQHLSSIPHEFRCNTRSVRLDFVRGVVDMVGLEYDSQYYIFLKRVQIDDFVFVLRSLGLYTTVTEKLCIHCTDPLEQIKGKTMIDFPVYVTYDIHLQKLTVQDYVGFIVNGNHRFLLKDFTVTHNTSIARCLAKVLDFPFEQISFGGVNHADFIKGFDFTYVGSRPGEISRCLSRMKYKNGIIFLDEYEKVAQNPEIISTLLHVTDFSQNHIFRDNYFHDLTIDLSSIWFIYSMNELPQDKALRDRIYSIHVDGYTEKEKIRITSDYLFPKNMVNIGKDKTDIVFDDDTIRYMVQKVCRDEKGIRNLEKAVKDVMNKIHFMVTNGNAIPCSFQLPSSCYPLTFPVTLTKQMIDVFLKDFHKESSQLSFYI